MPLVQYLALGKSIENVSSKGRYRLPATARRGVGHPELAPTPEEPNLLPATETCNFFEPAPAAAPEAPASQIDFPGEPAAPLAPREPVSTPAQAGRWTLAIKKRRGNTARKKTPTAVQREFALEAVRPLRNDLNDSDIEAVPVEAQALAGTARDAIGSQAISAWRRWPLSLIHRMRSWMA